MVHRLVISNPKERCGSGVEYEGAMYCDTQASKTEAHGRVVVSGLNIMELCTVVHRLVTPNPMGKLC